MFKQLFILVNSLGLFFISLFNGDNGVTFSHSIPATMPAGTETQAEIKIVKGEISGSGWLKIELPEGLILKAGESPGAGASAEEGAFLFTWDSLPGPEIVVKFTLRASENLAGDKEIKARFGYVENNEKQLSDMEAAKINISPAIAMPAVVPDSTITKAPDTTQTRGSMAEPPGEIIVHRTISQAANKKDFLVEVKIRKGGTKGFARYSDDAHENVNAKSIKTDGASFSIADGKIKFVWVNVPDREELFVSYSLSAAAGKKIMVSGEYSYLEDSQSKKVELKTDTLMFGEVPKETLVVSGPVKQETVTPDKPGNLPETIEKKDCKADFVVQVGAFTNSGVTAATMKRIFKISENIRSEMQGGFTKFLVGKHQEYKKARDHRNTMKNVNGVKSAFVAAYNNGTRVTVQEALMMCNQRWFP